MGRVWGWQTSIDAICNKTKITLGNENYIKEFLTELVKRIDMKAYGPPMVVHFATHDPAKGGYSAFQFIETSAITGHFVDATGELYLDVFSCKEYDDDIITQTLEEFFDAQISSCVKLERGVQK